MAKTGQGSELGGLEGIAAALPKKGPPPVEQWNPPFCGDIDMRIAADGSWFYQKTPIGRMVVIWGAMFPALERILRTWDVFSATAGRHRGIG